jgi:hypothetical protein
VDHATSAARFIADSFSTAEMFEIPFGTARKLKSVITFYRTQAAEARMLPSNAQRPAQRPTTTAGTSQSFAHSPNDANQAIHQKLSRWSSKLTVEFEKKFPNILRGRQVLIDEHFMAECPLCRVKYIIIWKGQFMIRNFREHLTVEQKRRAQLRVDLPPPPLQVNPSVTDEERRSSLPLINPQRSPRSLRSNNRRTT